MEPYADLLAVEVAAGQAVEQGQRIGRVGNGAVPGQHGATVASHLHFELRRASLPAGRWPSGQDKRNLVRAMSITIVVGLLLFRAVSLPAQRRRRH